MQGILVALKFLMFGTRRRGVQPGPEQVGAAAPYFPLVGLGVGLILAILSRGLEPHLDSEILSVVLVAVLCVITGGVHLAGLQRTFDALSTRSDIAKSEASPANTGGVLAVLFVVLLKVRSVEVIGELLGLSLLLTPVFARWGLVLFLYGSTSTRDETTEAMAGRLTTWHMIITSGITLAFGFFFAGRTALWIGLCVSLLALLGRSFLLRRYGGITYENFGAVVEISEALGFLFFAIV